MILLYWYDKPSLRLLSQVCRGLTELCSLQAFISDFCIFFWTVKSSVKATKFKLFPPNISVLCIYTTLCLINMLMLIFGD